MCALHLDLVPMSRLKRKRGGAVECEYRLSEPTHVIHSVVCAPALFVIT